MLQITLIPLITLIALIPLIPCPPGHKKRDSSLSPF